MRMGQKWSSRRRRQRGGARQSTVDDPSLTPPLVDKDTSLSVRAALSGRAISPYVPSTPNSDHQPTPSGSLSAEKERSESALKPTAALTVLTLGSVAGQVCVCACVCVKAGMN